MNNEVKEFIDGLDDCKELFNWIKQDYKSVDDLWFMDDSAKYENLKCIYRKLKKCNGVEEHVSVSLAVSHVEKEKIAIALAKTGIDAKYVESKFDPCNVITFIYVTGMNLGCATSVQELAQKFSSYLPNKLIIFDGNNYSKTLKLFKNGSIARKKKDYRLDLQYKVSTDNVTNLEYTIYDWDDYKLIGGTITGLSAKEFNTLKEIATNIELEEIN